MKDFIIVNNNVFSFIFFRFDHLFRERNYIVATCTHPRFKLDWISDEEKVRAHRLLVAQELSEITDTTKSSQLPPKDPLYFPSRNSATLDEIEMFFIDKEVELNMLDKYPKVKALFVKTNTGLPSSAPVERLFSAGPLVLTARRNRLSDSMFESLLTLKVNKKL